MLTLYEYGLQCTFRRTKDVASKCVGEVAERLRVPRHQLLLPAQHGFTITPARISMYPENLNTLIAVS